MKKYLLVFSCVLSALFLVDVNMAAQNGNGTRPSIIKEVKKPDLTIREGYVSQKKETVKIIRNGKVAAKVKLGKPIMVAQAEEEESWGYFQFPSICRSDNGRLIVSWQMNADSHKAYGQGVNGRVMSRSKGKTWEPLDQKYFIRGGMSVQLNNGDVIQIFTPVSKDISQYSSFPEPLYNDSSLRMKFYLEKDLPDDLKGMYLSVRDGRTKESMRIHGELDDPGLMRYAIDGLMPIMWWGEIKELEDGSLVGGIYRTYYKDLDDGTPKSCITFYKSQDGGSHWKAIGRIPYRIDEIQDKSLKYDSTRGYSEASFDILKDGTYFCVLRTGYNTPMYRCYSYDEGRTWTEPIAFTSNGVKPQLLRLGNGVTALASGRPGLQLRFCLDGDGEVWTEPIEMLPFMDEDGNYDMWGFGCGYPQLFKVKNNVFYLVYSDFKTLDENGAYRKAIMFRKIKVIKYCK